LASLSSINFKIGADLKDFRSSLRNIDRGISDLSQGFGMVGKAIGAAFITDQIVQFGTEASEMAGRMEGVENAFNRFADPSLLDGLRKATRGTTNDLELMTAAVKAQNFGIPMKEMSTLLEFASRRAQETGESVDFLVQSIVTGIGRKSPMILDNLGISTTRLKDEFNGAAVEAQSIGDVTAAVARIAKEEMGSAGAAFTSTADRAAAFKASLDNVKMAIGEGINAVLGPMLEKMTGIFNVVTDLLGTKLSEQYQEEAERVAALSVELEASNTPLERKQQILDELKTKYPDYLGNIDAEKSSTMEVKSAMESLNKELINRAVIMASQEKLDKIAEKRGEMINKLGENKVALSKQIAKFQKDENIQVDASNMTLEEHARALLRELEAKKKGQNMNMSIFGSYMQLTNALKAVDGRAALLAQTEGELNFITKERNDILKALGASEEDLKTIRSGGTKAVEKETESVRVLTDEQKKQLEAMDAYSRKVALLKMDLAAMPPVLDLFNMSMADVTAGLIEPNAKILTLDESLAKLQFTMNGLEPDFEELTGAFAGLNEQVPLLAKTSANALDVTRFFIDDFASSLQTAFEASITNGESFLKVFGNMMKAMIARLLAAAAAAIVLAIALSAIFPSGFALSSGGDLLSGASLAKGIFGKMTGIPMLAEGGIVTGPTLAMVGEGGGPEAVIPLDRLGSFMNGGNVTVTGRIQGSDILLSSERADRQRSRYRGF
jgi:hypothetical protein